MIQAKNLAAAAIGFVLLLQIIAPALVAPAMWGIRSWDGIPFEWRALLFVIGVSLISRSASVVFDPMFFAPKWPRWKSLVALLGVTSLMFALRTEVNWGNSSITGEDAARDRVTLKHTLSTAALALVYRVQALFGHMDSVDAVALGSILVGVFYFVISFRLGEALFPHSILKARVVGLVFSTSGLIQQFFGVIECYPLTIPIQMWVLIRITKLIDPSRVRTASAVNVALLSCSVSTSTFIATIFLWPATLLAVFRDRLLPTLYRAIGLPDARSDRRTVATDGTAPSGLNHPDAGIGASTPGGHGVLRKTLVAVVYATGPIAAMALLIHVLAITKIGYGWRLLLETFGGIDGSGFVPLNLADRPTNFFSLFSWEHAAARWNAAFYGAAAWFPLTVLCFAKRESAASDRDERDLCVVLGLAALGSLSYYFLIHPDLGPPLDWMETAAGMVAPLTFLLWYTLSRVTDETAARLGTLLVGLGTLHTLPRLLANAGYTGGAF